MSVLFEIKSATKLGDVARILGFSPSGLSYILYKQPIVEKYEIFNIPKRSGGLREIRAPKGALKAIQRELATKLNKCRAELMTATPRRPISHGFRESLSIITNAQNHKNKRYVLNIDLADFFPTFNFGRVRGFFIADRDFALNEKVATVLAQIACFDNSLPQGSPCSPVIADMIAHILDIRLLALAKANRVTYSRYADDLTFSTNQKSFPIDIARGGASPEEPWALGAPLINTIERAGFRINSAKTRMQVRGSRQMVTGLTVNEKVNVPQNYWRAIRSMCHGLFMRGEYHLPLKVYGMGPPAPPVMIKNLAPLAGLLSHAYNVKRSGGYFINDKSQDVVFGHADIRNFWFYKYFVAPDRPVVICEGSTDNVYMRNAMRRLAGTHPALAESSENGTKFKVALFSYENQIHKILGLKGGTGHFKSFIFTYHSTLKRFKHRPLRYPVIILADNDEGLSKKFCGELKRHFGADVTHASTEPFFHLTENLYLVKTPLAGTQTTSCIEDLFDATTRAMQVDGKIFHSQREGFDSTRHIGKTPFATKIVAPKASEISWNGFIPLLDRLIAVLNHYRPPIGTQT